MSENVKVVPLEVQAVPLFHRRSLLDRTGPDCQILQRTETQALHLAAAACRRARRLQLRAVGERTPAEEREPGPGRVLLIVAQEDVVLRGELGRRQREGVEDVVALVKVVDLVVVDPIVVSGVAESVGVVGPLLLAGGQPVNVSYTHTHRSINQSINTIIIILPRQTRFNKITYFN